MTLEIISYQDLFTDTTSHAGERIRKSLFEYGIVGIRDVPNFLTLSRDYVNAARCFTALPEEIKQQYAPQRDEGDTEGYELGAEKFQDAQGNWHTDDKKSSFYAFVPNKETNKWPKEVDLKTAYLALGELIFATGKHVLNFIGINEKIGISHAKLTGYGRMLHYHKESVTTNVNPNWCGAHFDHSIFTGLMPAYYFQEGIEVDEPAEAGLYIKPTHGTHFEKIQATDKSVLLFQVGEFGQVVSNDGICATEHVVKKAFGNIERYAFALFYDCHPDVVVNSTSRLTKDARYADHKNSDGSLSYGKWEEASFARYRVL